MSLIILSTSKGASGPSYAKFSAYLDTQTGFAAGGQNQIGNPWPGETVFKIDQCGVNNGGLMWGSSYGAYLTNDSNWGRICQHAFPTLALFNSYVANPTWRIRLIKGPVVTTSTLSLTRNGYTSDPYSSYACTTITLFQYWDDVQKKAFQYNPFQITPLTEITL